MTKHSDAEYYSANSERIKKRCNQYYHANKEKVQGQKALQPNGLKLLWAARSRARVKGLPCDIEVKDIIIPKLCPILGIPLAVGSGRFTNNSPTLDRIDPQKGYTKGNIVVISWRANKLKSDASLDELKALLRFYEEDQCLRPL